MQNSFHNIFPSDYKLSSYEVILDQNLYKSSRKVYDVTAFLGSVGGLEYNFDVIGGFFTAWLATTNARYFFNNKLYRVHSVDYKKKRINGIFKKQNRGKKGEVWRKTIEEDY